MPDYLIKLDNGQANVSDSEGKIKFWVNDSAVSDDINYCVTALTDNKDRGYCVIGKDFDRESRKLQNYTIYINRLSSGSDKEDESDADSDSDEDAGSFWPIIRNCGKRRTDVSDDTIVYDDVYYAYYEDGECHIFGDGLVEGERMKYELNEYGIDSIKKLVICDGVKMCDVDSNSSIINGWFNYMPIEEIEFEGNNGKIIADNFTSASCKSLTDLKLVGFEKIKSAAFMSCVSLINISLPENLKEIEYHAFAYNASLNEIVFPKSLKTIDTEAFQGCKSLRNVTLNNGLEIIGPYAFQGTDIRSINIPASVKELKTGAFNSCLNLKTVIINGDIITGTFKKDEDGKIKDSYGNTPFSTSPVETLILNDGVTDVGIALLRGCPNLKTVRLSRNLKKIGYEAFASTPKLTKIVLPNSLETIEESAFNGSGLTSVTIPRNVATIGTYAFSNNSLTDITILSKECKLAEGFVPSETTIWGYTGSTAEAYANKYGNPFKALDTPAVTTTAATTTTATTTTAAVVTTQVAPDSECVFIAVKDKDTAGASSDKVFADGNVKYFDQQTADANGVVSFSYLPDEKEKWAFIFVSQVINDTITKTFGTADDLKTTTYNVAPGVKGDANGDGEIDMSDVVLIMQALANPNKYGIEGTDPKHITENGFKFADSDGDGLTVNDALRIQQYLLGIIPALT